MATVEHAPDAELILRLRARDRSAWEELYGEFQPRLRAFAYRLTGNAHDADDLVQETFVRAVPRLDKLDPASVELGAYLFATCKNLFYKHVERTKRTEPVADVPEPAVPAHIEDEPERAALLRSQQRDVRFANARLDPRQRLVLALRELEDRSYGEIGEIVGLKENAVAQLIFRARESLRVEVRLAQVDPDRLPVACRNYLPLLARHLDGELSGPRLDETLHHLESCERCQGALADMREASRRYRALVLPPFLDGDDCKAAIDRRFDESGYWARAVGRRFGGHGIAAISIAGLLVLAIGGVATGVVLADDEPTATPVATSTESESVRPPSRPATTAETIPGRSPVPTPVVPAGPPPATPAQTTTEVRTDTRMTDSQPSFETTPTTSKPKPDTNPKPDLEPKPPPSSGGGTAPPVPAPDATAPVVTVTSAPSATVSLDKVEIGFRADDPAATFQCSTDGSQAAPCSSPVVLSGLAPGEHRFSVLATDEAGNSSAWTVLSWTFVPPDTSAPIVRITTAPPRSTTDPNARFEFSADESPVTFECALDKAAFAKCSSPTVFTKLGYGAHSFAVRATDAAGNVGASATASWTIARPLPDLAITAFAANSIQITNQGTASAPVNVLTITLVGTFTVPALAPGASIRLTWSTCRTGTYTAIVDRSQTVTESNETNNTASRNSTCSVVG